MAYVNRLLNLSAMQKWYQSALIEKGREEEHEQEVIDIIVENLRMSI